MITSELQEGPVILIGYEYRLQLQAAADLFPEDASFTGQLRRTVSDNVILASLSSENGGVLRQDLRTIEIVLAPNITAGLSPGSVTLDLVRTDLDPDRHLGVLIEIPVAMPVTRGL